MLYISDVWKSSAQEGLELGKILGFVVTAGSVGNEVIGDLDGAALGILLGRLVVGREDGCALGCREGTTDG